MAISKKTLVTAIAVSSLGLSTLSLADDNSTDASQTVTHSSEQNSSGIIVGGQLGYNKYSQKDQKTGKYNKDASKTMSGLDDRIYVGYQFNPYFAVETGYGFMHRSINVDKVKANDIHVNLNTIDIAAKGILPLSVLSDSLSNANLFAKVGAAEVIANTKGKTKGETNSARQLDPEFGGGAGYNFDSGLGLDVSYMRIQGRKIKDQDSIASQNKIMGGISYRFNI